ncbi:hypothetical protein J5N97_025737 [Dioscorea zingiberensis]|uniref:Uncharacterized protein n=1 Tax=Dioscorea zingiberensis TaxID=325984 RepID=A0A9D5C270_9LILI|nr:hypothetical protein J5N97_025737 [Dioscorea zingiberensis]
MLIVCSVELREAIAAFWPEDVIGSLLEYLDVPLLNDTNSDVSMSKGEGTDFGEPIQLAYIYLPSDHIDLKAATDAELTVADVTGITEMTSMNVIPLMTEQLIALAVAIHDNIKEGGPLEIDTKLLHQFANGLGVILTSLAAILGRTVGQEVVKACSGKLHPLHQFFYFDSVESLSVYTLNPGEVEPKFCRYDDQIVAISISLQFASIVGTFIGINGRQRFVVATCGRQPKLMLTVCSVELREAIAAFWPEDVIGSLLEYLDVPLLHDTNSDVSMSKGEGDDNNDE